MDILHESDNLCKINTMFDHLILAFFSCLLWSFKGVDILWMQLHILWWACIMLSVNTDHYAPFSTWIRPQTRIYRRRTMFYCSTLRFRH